MGLAVRPPQNGVQPRSYSGPVTRHPGPRFFVNLVNPVNPVNLVNLVNDPVDMVDMIDLTDPIAHIDLTYPLEGHVCRCPYPGLAALGISRSVVAMAYMMPSSFTSAVEMMDTSTTGPALVSRRVRYGSRISAWLS